MPALQNIIVHVSVLLAVNAESWHQGSPSGIKWHQKPGLNCLDGIGATSMGPGKDPMLAPMSVPECQAACVNTPGCEGIVMPSFIKMPQDSQTKGECSLRKNIVIPQCTKDPSANLYLPNSFVNKGANPHGVLSGRHDVTTWRKHVGLDCTNLRGTDVPDHQALSVQDCQASCAITPATCAGIVMHNKVSHKHGSSRQSQGACFKMLHISLNACRKSDSYNTYTPDNTRRLWDKLQGAFALVGTFTGSGATPVLMLGVAGGGITFVGIFAAMAVWRRSRRGNWTSLLTAEGVRGDQ